MLAAVAGVSVAIVAGVAAAGGARTLAGFVSAPDAKRINPPVMYAGIGMLFVTPSLGEFYAEQYLTIGMGIRALSAGLAIYTLQTQTKLIGNTLSQSHRDNDADTASERKAADQALRAGEIVSAPAVADAAALERVAAAQRSLFSWRGPARDAGRAP